MNQTFCCVLICTEILPQMKKTEKVLTISDRLLYYVLVLFESKGCKTMHSLINKESKLLNGVRV